LQQAPDGRIPRCRRCGDVIGAYEPMVLVTDGRARITSRAAVGDRPAHESECFHERCYADAHDARTAAG
jgi:hypothetical protein